MEPNVTREATVDAPAEEVWRAITEEEARTSWLGDDGADRVVEVEHAVDGEQVTWRWWSPDDGPDAASRVTITLSPQPDGTTGVRVVEHLSASASAQAHAVAGGAAGSWAARLLELELWLLLAVERV